MTSRHAGGTLGSTSPTLPPDVVEPWGSSHGELWRSPHSPGDAVATPQVVIGKCPSEKAKKKKHLNFENFAWTFRITPHGTQCTVWCGDGRSEYTKPPPPANVVRGD
ncbi:jg17789 [Pararge aegeria aegeria]|uniref:Jg17789 protein n=1 Tax=Pararge aegeria aegeria TaxID=348720 RepID=A0A8S4R951_9NEOP|nr:jg17789 [Pararge aegeria aegeria]